MTTETKDLPPVPDPVGWLTRFVNRSGLNCQVLCNHNSVGDYRDIDPGATSERVYSESQMHAYALEAIRASATSASEPNKLQTALDVALTTLNQIAETPRNKGARPRAYATVKFLETQLASTTPQPAEPTQMERT